MNVIVSAQKLKEKGFFEAYCLEKCLEPAHIAEDEVFELDILEAIKYRVLSK